MDTTASPPPPPPACKPAEQNCDTKPPINPLSVKQPVNQYFSSTTNNTTELQNDSVSQTISDAIASGDYSFELSTNVPSSFPQNSTSGQISLKVNGITHTLNVEYAINDHRVTPMDPLLIAAWYDQYKNETVTQEFGFRVNYDGFNVDANNGQTVTETYVIRFSGQEISRKTRSFTFGPDGGSGNLTIQLR